MGRKERARYDNNEQARELLRISRDRPLSDDEIKTLRDAYTGSGGLSTWSNGQFFTPPVVTKFVIDLLGIRSGKVFEPSCGAGAFIQELPEACEVVGVEQMIETADVARLCNPRATITQGDTLTMMEQFRGQFDFCIGNPPFMKARFDPEHVGFDVTGKSKKAEWMFIELAFNALKPGGALAMVVPDGILSNNGDKQFRQYFLDNGVVRAVISLPRETFYFTGTGVKTSVFLIQKKVPNIDYGNYPVFMSIVENIGWDSRGRATNKCDLPQVLDAFRLMYPGGIQPDTVHAHPAGDVLLSDNDNKGKTAPAAAPEPQPVPVPAPFTKLPWEMSSHEWITEKHRVMGSPLEQRLTCGVSPEWRRQHVEKGTWIGKILAELYPDSMDQGATSKDVVHEHPRIVVGLKELASYELTLGEYKALARCDFEQRMAEAGRPLRWFNIPDLADQALESLHRLYVSRALQDGIPVSARVLDDYEGITVLPVVDVPAETPRPVLSMAGKSRRKKCEDQLSMQF